MKDSGSLTLGGSSGFASLSAGADLIANGTGTEAPNAILAFFNSSKLEIGGSLTLGDGAQMVNYGSAGPLVIDSGATVSYPAGAAADSSTISVPVVNSGTLGVSTGTLTLNNPYGNASTNDGSLTAGSGATRSRSIRRSSSPRGPRSPVPGRCRSGRRRRR